MSKTIPQLEAMLAIMGTPVTFHREEGEVPCPCRTPEGFRDPAWHAPIAAAYEPMPVESVSIAAAGQVTGTVRYAVGYRWEIPSRPPFNMVTVLSDPLVVANATVQVDFEEFHAADFAPDPVVSIILYRSINGGPLIEIGQWVDIVPPVNENQAVGFAGAQPIAPPPECNELGILPSTVTDIILNAVVQPVTGGQHGRAHERMERLLGSVQMDDHFAVFPCITPGGVALNFREWGEAGEDYIVYDGRRYVVVAADKLADIDGDPNHHWEVGLRLVSAARPV